MKYLLVAYIILGFGPLWAQSTPETSEILFNSEIHPSFPGGFDELIDYLDENLEYPKKARRAKVTGTVYVTFVVNKNGSLTNLRVNKGIGHGCDKEAIRLVQEMPFWNPGIDKDEIVRVEITLAIEFDLFDITKR